MRPRQVVKQIPGPWRRFDFGTQAGVRNASRTEGRVFSLREPGVFANLYIPKYPGALQSDYRIVVVLCGG